MISFNPSITCSSSSTEMRPSFLPSRFTESVLIWLIFTHERLGRFAPVNSSVSGKPARGSWLVRAQAITVPDRSLKTSWLNICRGSRRTEKAKKLYTYLTYFAGGKGCSWPSFGLLAEKLHCFPSARDAACSRAFHPSAN